MDVDQFFKDFRQFMTDNDAVAESVCYDENNSQLKVALGDKAYMLDMQDWVYTDYWGNGLDWKEITL